ncbi:uncharacterized protein CXQ87_002942 [Candidozyma duobushaemuli]|uniref:Uncharacterized protein n=2 Tax=Candidozyma TaxID=3303203 RepID=A0ABX8IAM5_9ASCO|nr:uncharacterized protein CXQ87_002942 [[Candida] duobushaemulonis]PVH15107.1 hypothetical protein CXQ87_002942 [[Candida] duobushaemulonis]QWU88363.1 hypothetical protein CA3LBN_002671 [[Candida] haemuloni]
MSHPAASIKSIFSGKVNLTDSGFEDVSDNNASFRDGQQDDGQDSTADFSKPKSYFSDDEPISDSSYHDSPNQLRNPTPMISTSAPSDGDNYSVSSRNLRLMMMQKGEVYDQQNSSTNISLASSGSDYQAPIPNDPATYNYDASQNGLLLSDSLSRPLSRNSTTSCLSTTATKDGVEGKKLHRHGPTPYFSSVIANMLSQQQQQQQQAQQQQAQQQQAQQQQAHQQDRQQENQQSFAQPPAHLSNPTNPTTLKQTPPTTFEASLGDEDLSVASHTNGESGNKQLNDCDSLGLPPVTLKEKMMLLNPDQPRS